MSRPSTRWLVPLTRGMLGLTLLTTTLSIGPGQAVRPTSAQEEETAVDCNDEAHVKDWDCIQQRQAAEQQAGPPPEQQPPPDAPPPPDSTAKANDPTAFVFTLEDAGKEATPYLNEQGEDNCGRWARTRFERYREPTGIAFLGPTVMDSKAWVCKDVDAAKALFKSQGDINNFPERTQDELITGPNEKLKPFNVAEETSVRGTYFQNKAGVIWQHYRVVMRKGKNVVVIYLFGREDLFTEKSEDRDPNGKLVEWISRTMAGKM